MDYHPDQVLTTSWFWLAMFVVNGLHDAWLVLHYVILPNTYAIVCHNRFYQFPLLFLSNSGKDQLWLTDTSAAVSMDCGLGSSVISLGVVW